MKKILPFLALCLLILPFLLGWFDGVNPQSVRDFVLGFGDWAPLIFILIYCLAPLVPFFSAVLAMAGGMIFGLGHGSVLIMIGASCGACLAFWLAGTFSRWFRSKYLSEKQGDKLEKLEIFLGENGFQAVLLVRLVPLFPYDVVSYCAGVSGVGFQDYILATLIGIVPGVLVYANIGANALEINSVGFYVSLALLAGLAGLSLLLKKRMQRRMQS